MRNYRVMICQNANEMWLCTVWPTLLFTVHSGDGFSWSDDSVCNSGCQSLSHCVFNHPACLLRRAARGTHIIHIHTNKWFIECSNCPKNLWKISWKIPGHDLCEKIPDDSLEIKVRILALFYLGLCRDPKVGKYKSSKRNSFSCFRSFAKHRHRGGVRLALTWNSPALTFPGTFWMQLEKQFPDIMIYFPVGYC